MNDVLEMVAIEEIDEMLKMLKNCTGKDPRQVPADREFRETDHDAILSINSARHYNSNI
jgi:hypothetical protein